MSKDVAKKNNLLSRLIGIPAVIAFLKRNSIGRYILGNMSYIREFLRHYVIGLALKIDKNHTFLLAGGLAFSIFVCIVPFILIIFWILGNLLDSVSVEVQINTLIETVIPYQQYAEYVKEILYARVSEFVEYKNVAGLLGVGGLLFAASGFFSSVRTVLNTVFEATSDVSLLMGKLLDFAWVFLVILLFLVSTLFLPMIDVLRDASELIPFFGFLNYGIFQKIFTTIFSFAIIYFLFSLLYQFVPVAKIRKRAVAVGALWAAFLWEAAKQLFGYYIYNFASFGRIYGTYALIVVVAFWIYYSAAVFIVGAEIGKLFHERLQQKGVKA